MSDSVLSKLTVELEARQAKLDRDLDEAEGKAKRSGERMEESLSLGGLAAKLVGAFAALGAVEGSLRSIDGVVKLMEGNAAGALEAFERMPFGIGPAVQAGHDLYDTLTGSREESERIVAAFANLPDLIRTSQAEAASLAQLLAGAGTRDQQAVAGINQRSSEINEQLLALDKVIGQLNRFASDRASGGGFGGGPEFGATSLDDAPSAIREALEEAGIAARTVGDALRKLRDERQFLLSLGLANRERGLEDLRAQALEQRNQQADRRNAARNPFEAERQALEREFGELIKGALSDALARELEQELEKRLREVTQRERQAIRDSRFFDLEYRDGQARRREERLDRPTPREPDPTVRTFSAEEFSRLIGGGTGKKQEVEDRQGNGLLNQIRDLIQRSINTPSTPTFG